MCSATDAATVNSDIPRQLLRLALPAFGSGLMRVLYQWVDALWVQGLGVDATAAVTSSIFVLWAVWSLNDIVAIGVTAYVSQLLGAGDRERAGLAAWKALRASFAIGLVGTFAGLFAGHRIFGLMSADPRTVATGGDYLTILLIAAPLSMMAMTCEHVMRASGDTRTPMLLDALAIGLNAVLAPFLIYGWGPFPRLGVRGAALATAIAWLVLFAGFMLLAARRHRALPLARSASGPPVHLLGMAKVGFPAFLIGALFSVVYIACARAASQYGTAAMAIVGIANRIEAIQFMTAVAIGTAGAALVGQNLGAGRPDRAEEVIRVGLRWGVSIAAVFTVVLLLVPGIFVRLFSPDPEVMRLGVPYLRILSLCMIVNAMEIVTSESVMGSGHTRVLSIIFTTFAILRMPLAFLVPEWTGTGVLGVAWVISVTCAVRSLLVVAWCARGTWKSGLQRELHGAAVFPDGGGAMG
jgi:putative MATE family efflux protein